MAGGHGETARATATDLDDYGELERADGSVVLRFTRRLAQPPATVWRALTEPDHLAAWFPTTIDGDRAVGARLRFGPKEVPAPWFDGEMLAFEPPSLLELTWGDETLRFEVRPDQDGSVLVMTCSFEELGKAARDGAGWHACLDQLACDVMGTGPPPSPAERWRELFSAYKARFGPDASTMGPPQEWERVHGAATTR
jgi:uncharacterized protein YndB with AHSA1/START domain